ncbi:hypothetical protein Lal_00020932 [Lupinus albus]|uniref:Uncharacterized protein n=1 Tax=Lupinus albus TaxID=3870 RepID=A0A6A4QNF7_LUPAL|nr:hypothetical protein Lalb_Chr04g0255461 [Lupinus albus]KAF1869255.1 hypothetical protein Lal_00020932 [Lupinus albus]
MKLVHSNTVHDPESQSFDLDESDLFTPVYQLQKKKVKDYQNNICIDLKRNERDCMTAPKVEFCDNVIDFKRDYQARVKDVVKDICVGDGVPTKDMILFEMSVEEKAYNSFPSNDDKEMKKDNIENNVLNLPTTEKPDQVLANHDQSKDLMCKDEAVIQMLSDNVEETLPVDTVLLQELGKQEPRASDGEEEQVSRETESYSQSLESENVVEEVVLTSPTLASAVVETNCDTMSLEGESFIHMLNPQVLGASCGKEECHQVGGCKCEETQDTSKPVDDKSSDEAVLRQIRYSLGESSFSGVGHGSSYISYPQPVPYSGSISLRSDSSTMSTQSFAFPALPSEWNSSPVRMAKADKSNYRKHRGWRQGLLCCRF